MVKVERSGAFSVWTICRPESKNALSLQTCEDLHRAAEAAKNDATLRAVVLTGEGDAFASGADLRELRSMNSGDDAVRFADAGERVCAAIERLDVPVIAALPGPAYGGGAELAVACDLRIAEPRAKISFRQTRMGVTTGWGTIPRLVSLVGYATAARLLYTAHEIPAANAMSMGLVDAISDDGGSVTAALAWCSDVELGSPRAVAGMKALLRESRAAQASRPSREREELIATWTGPDHAEAVEAYFERRRPAWRNRL